MLPGLCHAWSTNYNYPSHTQSQSPFILGDRRNDERENDMYRVSAKHRTGQRFAQYERKVFFAETLEGLDAAILAEWPDADESNVATSTATEVAE